MKNVITLISLLTSALASGVPQQLQNEIQQVQAQNPGYPFYIPTNIVRLMVVAQNDASPFLTGVITTQGDKLVVANIPNGDPPMAFNVSAEYGFRAQNGKYIYFDYDNYVVRLDDQPHNETIYMEDGSVMTADMPAGMYPSVMLCPGPGNVFTLGFYSTCQFGSFVDIYPIPPQGLTQLWENHTQYPSPHQKGWMNWDVVNTTLGDNSTFDPSMITSYGGGTVLRGGGEKVTVGWLVGLSFLAVLVM